MSSARMKCPVLVSLASSALKSTTSRPKTARLSGPAGGGGGGGGGEDREDRATEIGEGRCHGLIRLEPLRSLERGGGGVGSEGRVMGGYEEGGCGGGLLGEGSV